MKRVDQISFNIDGTKYHEIVEKNRLNVLNKSRVIVRGNGTPDDLIGLAINLSDMVIVEVVFPVQI